MCPLIPDPSVNMHSVLGSFAASSYLCFAIFLFSGMLMECVGSHHGGCANGLMVSIWWDAYCGKVLAMYSRVVMCTLLFEVCTRRIADAIGCVWGAACIINVWSTLLQIRRCGDCNDVSISSAEVEVVRNAPKMAFITVLCAVSIFE